MPATAGRVRMPANNRLSVSDSLRTSEIWQKSVGYDPYAPTERQSGAGGADHGVTRGDDRRIDAHGSEINEKAKGLFVLARLTGSSSAVTPGACRKCGQVGHLAFQCRNNVSVGEKSVGPIAHKIEYEDEEDEDDEDDEDEEDEEDEDEKKEEQSDDEKRKKIKQSGEGERKRERRKKSKDSKRRRKRRRVRKLDSQDSLSSIRSSSSSSPSSSSSSSESSERSDDSEDESDYEAKRRRRKRRKKMREETQRRRHRRDERDKRKRRQKKRSKEKQSARSTPKKRDLERKYKKKRKDEFENCNRRKSKEGKGWEDLPIGDEGRTRNDVERGRMDNEEKDIEFRVVQRGGAHGERTRERSETFHMRFENPGVRA